MNEFTLQRECVNWMRTHLPNVRLHASGAGYLGQKGHAKQVSVGYTKGNPDLEMPLNKIAIEFKFRDGKMSKEQVECMMQYRRAGWAYYLVNSYDDFIAIMMAEFQFLVAQEEKVTTTQTLDRWLRSNTTSTSN